MCFWDRPQKGKKVNDKCEAPQGLPRLAEAADEELRGGRHLLKELQAPKMTIHVITGACAKYGKGADTETPEVGAILDFSFGGFSAVFRPNLAPRPL